MRQNFAERQQHGKCYLEFEFTSLKSGLDIGDGDEIVSTRLLARSLLCSWLQKQRQEWNVKLIDKSCNGRGRSCRTIDNMCIGMINIPISCDVYLFILFIVTKHIKFRSVILPTTYGYANWQMQGFISVTCGRDFTQPAKYNRLFACSSRVLEWWKRSGRWYTPRGNYGKEKADFCKECTEVFHGFSLDEKYSLVTNIIMIVLFRL